MGLDKNVGMESEETDALNENKVPVVSLVRFSLSFSLTGWVISAGRYEILELESTHLGSGNNLSISVFNESHMPPGDRSLFGNINLDRWPFILHGKGVEPRSSLVGDIMKRLIRTSIFFSRLKLISSSLLASLTLACSDERYDRMTCMMDDKEKRKKS